MDEGPPRGTKLSAGRHAPGPTRQLRTLGMPRDGTEDGQHRWGGALGRAAPDSQDGGRAAGKLAGAPGVQRDGRLGGGALGRRSNRLVPSAAANRPTAKEREAV